MMVSFFLTRLEGSVVVFADGGFWWLTDVVLCVACHPTLNMIASGSIDTDLSVSISVVNNDEF